MFKYDFLKRDIPAGAVIFRDGDKIVSHIYDKNIEYIGDNAREIIQKTIDSVSPGQTIYIKAGTYVIDGTLTSVDEVILRGEGKATKIYPTGAFDPFGANIKIRDIYYKDKDGREIYPKEIERYWFDFRAQDKTNVDRIAFDGSPFTRSYTTSTSTNSTTPVLYDSFTYDSTGKPTPRKLRVIFYGYSGQGAPEYIAYRVTLDGNEIASGTSSATSTTKLVDVVVDVSAGSHTVNVYFWSSSAGNPAWAVSAYYFDCYGVSTTTAVTVCSYSFDPTTEYTLSVKGDFKYEVGCRFRVTVTYYRKTTAASTLAVNDKTFSIAAGDEGTTLTGATSRFYSTFPLTSNYTVNINVGASGDVIWIRSLTLVVQVTLRGNQRDKYNNRQDWNFIINTTGVGCFHAHSKTLTGDVYYLNVVYQPSPGGYITELLPSAASELKSYNIILNIYDTKVIHNQYGGDANSLSVFISLIVTVVG